MNSITSLNLTLKHVSSVQDDGSHTRMTRRLGADGLISPTLSLSLRLTRAHFQGNQTS